MRDLFFEVSMILLMSFATFLFIGAYFANKDEDDGNKSYAILGGVSFVMTLILSILSIFIF